MSNLRYKDYQGSVTFVDGTLLIQIQHIEDLVTTRCDGASEAQAAFEELVDDYVKACAEMNRSPSKPFKGTFAPSLHRALAMQAAESGQTLNAYIQKALEEKVERSRSHKRVLASLSYTRLFHSEEYEWNQLKVRTRAAQDNPVIESIAKFYTPSLTRGLRN